MRETFYESRRWKKVRERILKRDKYQDQWLLQKGIIREANVVHHCLPREKYPQYQFCEWNLISLSWNTHRSIIHNAYNGELTKDGLRLMKEVAFKNGVKLQMITLVIGLEGSGKTTYVKEHLGDGIAYDLDYIASAFRLKQPHKEYHGSSRKMANALFKAWCLKATDYNSNVFVIRTAPSIDDLNEIQPNKLVVCKRKYNVKGRADYTDRDTGEDIERIADCLKWAEMNGIPIEKL